MAATAGPGPNDPLLSTLAPDTLEKLRDWAEGHVCKQVLYGSVQSSQTWQHNAVISKPGMQWAFKNEGMVQLICEGYQWRVWSGLITHTSNTMKLEVQQYRANGQSHGDMLVDITNLGIHPYILQEVIEFWCTIQLSMTYEKRKVVNPDTLPRHDAPTDFSNTMTGLMSLVHLVDAAYALNDTVLKRTALAELRGRLVAKTFTSSEFIDALDAVYNRKPDRERNIVLRKIFLSAAIVNVDTITRKGSAEGSSFLQQQFWYPDFMHDIFKGMEFCRKQDASS